MKRGRGLLTGALGASAMLLALAGILCGSLPCEADWERFVAAVGGVLGGIDPIGQGGIRYAGVCSCR